MILSALLSFVGRVLSWFCSAIGLPNVPDWLAQGIGYLIGIFGDAIRLISWLFPSEAIFRGFCGFFFDCIFAILMVKLIRWFLTLYDKLKI